MGAPDDFNAVGPEGPAADGFHGHAVFAADGGVQPGAAGLDFI